MPTKNDIHANAVVSEGSVKPSGGHRRDLSILRSLAQRYAEIAHLDIQQQRTERYYRTISMEEVRPVVLISEVPWGEIRDLEMKNQCENEEYWWLEHQLRRTLYQWDHFQVDMVVPPTFRVAKQISSTGIGITIEEVRLTGDTGSHISSHEYKDQLATEEDLERLQLPVIAYDRESTEREAELVEEVFQGLLPVEVTGTVFCYNIWDRISEFRGVDKLLLDLAMRPDFMHKIARRLMEIGASIVEQYQRLDLLDTSPLIVHCTPACARELPAADHAGTTRLKDVWGRCAAQIFSGVSPEMHDEFDLEYNQELFGEFGLLYYGCCEPLDTKVDILRKRFANLRKISITPWADPDTAASHIGSDYVLAAKPNPALVNMPTFESEPVEEEIRRILDACSRHGTTCEFVLKDISTIANNPDNLTQWAGTVESVIDQYC